MISCGVWIGCLALRNDVCTNGSADSAVSHICPRIEWLICLSCTLPYPPSGRRVCVMLEFEIVRVCFYIYVVTRPKHTETLPAAPCWCLSGCNSNCKALKRVRRSSGAHQSTSANSLSNRCRRKAHAASTQPLVSEFFASEFSGFFCSGDPARLSRCPRIRAGSALSRRVLHHWQISSESLLSSRHLLHSHLTITFKTYPLQ